MLPGYDTWKTTPPATREWTDEDEAELQARWECDPVCMRLEKELNARREQIRQRYLEDVRDV